MTDTLTFGLDTTDERLESEKKQRTFTKQVKEKFFCDVLDVFDPVKGIYKCTVEILEQDENNYFSWILSCDWCKCSSVLSDMAEAGAEYLQPLFELSKKQYPEAYEADKLSRAYS